MCEISPKLGSLDIELIGEALAHYTQKNDDPAALHAYKSKIFEKLGLLCLEMGNTESAQRLLNLAIFANPSDESIYRQRNRLHHGKPLPKRTISVVMPTYNHYRDLVECVRNIRRNSFFPVQIVMVADPCDDGTVEFLREQNNKDDFVSHINEEHLGSVPSLILGLYLAEGDYIAFLNDDVQVMPGWDLESILAIDDDKAAGCAVPLVVHADGTAQSVGQHNPFLSDKYEWIGRMPALDHGAACGKNLLSLPMFHYPRECDYGYFPVLKRQCLYGMGFVDPNYKHYYLDPDIGYSLQKHGWKNIYVPTSVLVHHHRSMNDMGQVKVVEKARADKEYFVDKWGVYLA